MSERKPCIRCGRQIDEFAKACPFCGWNQTVPPPSPEEWVAPAYVPPPQRRWSKKIIGVAAFAALVVIAFTVGTLIHGFEPSDVKAAQSKPAAPAPVATAPSSPRSNVTLVPVTGSEGMEAIEQPITTAPATTPGQQPNDATALPSAQYSAAAARAKAQQEAAQKTKSAMIDPRTLTGSASEQRAPGMASASSPAPQPKPRVESTDTAEPASTPAQPESASTPMRTNAYLQYKPLPHITVDHDVTARLNLTVDADGHVTDIDVSDPVPEMSRLISAVQNWRFKPATENGAPVTSRVSVDITFRANE